ncbi:MAG: FtsX-like permease family protein [Candidatus Aminicenantes bacterium]|nr:FtsX-like permease family protein [Candidatus Aminicenantes bacterium]
MNFIKTSRVALMALGRNKMRSFLTALGIIIGVGAVIAMVSIGQGAKADVERRFNEMGSNLLFVRPGSMSFRGRHGGGGSFQTMKETDAQAILDSCDAVTYVSPNVNTRAQVIYQNKNWNSTIYGVGHSYPIIRNWDVQDGQFFTEQQVNAGQKVCILGSEVYENLFEGAPAIGQIVRIKRIPFRILGVMEAKGETGFMSRDDVIFIPYKTAMMRLLGADYIQSIDVSAASLDSTAEAQAQIEEILRIRHKIAPGAEDDFNVRNMSDIAESASESTRILTILLGGIASISLLVGGIGIMNIMLVSVTERIREIGIRMSVGAKERDILLQFLTEAIVLSLLGGILGIALGIGSAQLISRLSPMQTVVLPSSIALAFLFSGSVGVFFGFYPARKASKLDPIDALRYE